MKKIDKLVLHSFVQHLLLAFLVIVFLLLCRQMLVLFDDIIGKGVGIQALAQLFFQFAIFMVPISIPLAVLLSSLMTMGSFSEHFELTALKSIGVSPNRVILPMFSLVCFLSLVAFYANNYLVPKAALNAYSLLYDIKQKKPALDLQAGVFYSDIPGFNIKIGKKYDDGVTLKDIMIYDHREAKFNGKVTLADSGVMSTLKNERYLKLELFNGHFYRDNGLNYENREQEKGGLSRSYFSKSTYLLDVSGFDLVRSSKNRFAGIGKMRNLTQLSHDLDSVQQKLATYAAQAKKEVDNSPKSDSSGKDPGQQDDRVLQLLQERPLTWSIAHTTAERVRSVKAKLQLMNAQREKLIRKRAEFEIQYHKIWAQSAACLVMVLIGGAFGAIIKKGGLGLPVLISVAFFIISYVINMQGEKYAKQSLLDPFWAMWMSNLVLLPVGLFLLWQVREDSKALDIDAGREIWDKIKAKVSKRPLKIT